MYYSSNDIAVRNFFESYHFKRSNSLYDRITNHRLFKWLVIKFILIGIALIATYAN